MEHVSFLDPRTEVLLSRVTNGCAGCRGVEQLICLVPSPPPPNLAGNSFPHQNTPNSRGAVMIKYGTVYNTEAGKTYARMGQNI